MSADARLTYKSKLWKNGCETKCSEGNLSISMLKCINLWWLSKVLPIILLHQCEDLFECSEQHYSWCRYWNDCSEASLQVTQVDTADLLFGLCHRGFSFSLREQGSSIKWWFEIWILIALWKREHLLSHCQVVQVKSLQSCMSGEEGLEKLYFGGVLASTVHFETFLWLISLFFGFSWLLFFPETWNVNLLPFKNKQSSPKAKVGQTKKLVEVIIENTWSKLFSQYRKSWRARKCYWSLRLEFVINLCFFLHPNSSYNIAWRLQFFSLGLHQRQEQVRAIKTWCKQLLAGRLMSFGL